MSRAPADSSRSHSGSPSPSLLSPIIPPLDPAASASASSSSSATAHSAGSSGSFMTSDAARRESLPQRMAAMLGRDIPARQSPNQWAQMLRTALHSSNPSHASQASYGQSQQYPANPALLPSSVAAPAGSFSASGELQGSQRLASTGAATAASETAAAQAERDPRAVALAQYGLTGSGASERVWAAWHGVKLLASHSKTSLVDAHRAIRKHQDGSDINVNAANPQQQLQRQPSQLQPLTPGAGATAAPNTTAVSAAAAAPSAMAIQIA